MSIDLTQVKQTPMYICEIQKLESNLQILDRVQKESGAK